MRHAISNRVGREILIVVADLTSAEDEMVVAFGRFSAEQVGVRKIIVMVSYLSSDK